MNKFENNLKYKETQKDIFSSQDDKCDECYCFDKFKEQTLKALKKNISSEMGGNIFDFGYIDFSESNKTFKYTIMYHKCIYCRYSHLIKMFGDKKVLFVVYVKNYDFNERKKNCTKICDVANKLNTLLQYSINKNANIIYSVKK